MLIININRQQIKVKWIKISLNKGEPSSKPKEYI